MEYPINQIQFNVFVTRKFNTWYSINDGNWSDPNTWISNAMDPVYVPVPRAGDNVYINHTVTLDTTIAVNNIYISGTLKADNSSRILTVNGDMQATGAVDFTGSNVGVILQGVNNSVVSFTCGTASTVCYNSILTQTVMPVTYFNLEIAGGSSVIKYLIGNLTVNGHLYLGATINTNNFTISVGGTTSTGNAMIAGATATSTILSNSSITFIGQVITSIGHDLTVSNGAEIECRGGLNAANSSIIFTGSNVNFTTNNQSITIQNAGTSITCNNITITGAITISTTGSNASPFVLNGVMNGTVAGSTFNNNGWLRLTNTTLPMATGVFNYANTAGSTLEYNFNGAYTLPFTAYHNLIITGTGTKAANGNFTIANTLQCVSGTLDMLTFNLTVTGNTTLSASTGTLNKTGGGTVIFIGSLICATGSISSSFSGNPTVEIRGGINFTNGVINFGSGALSFTTNNQSITSGGGNNITFNGNVTVASGITVTRTSNTETISFNGTLNGASSTSNFTNKGIVAYLNAVAPMVTGQLYCNQAVNTWIYGLAGNQDITVPSDPTPGYQNLTLQGSGAKRLLGNVSVKGVYTLTGPATLNSNGFALTNP